MLRLKLLLLSLKNYFKLDLHPEAYFEHNRMISLLKDLVNFQGSVKKLDIVARFNLGDIEEFLINNRKLHMEDNLHTLDIPAQSFSALIESITYHPKSISLLDFISVLTKTLARFLKTEVLYGLHVDPFA